MDFLSLKNTSFNPKPLSIVASVDECAEYMYNVSFAGFIVPLIFIAVRSRISLIKKPDRKRTSSGVARSL